MKTILSLLALLLVGTVWALGHTRTMALRHELAARHRDARELEALRRERDRLRAGAPDAGELARLQHEAAAGTGNPAEAPPTAEAPPPRLVVGEWIPAAAWQNRGRATPVAAIETMLWAAAGGDTAALRSLLHLDEPTRTTAEQMLAHLPPDARSLYASPEQLVAAFATKAIPLGEAQLVWQHQTGADLAAACVWVTDQAPVAANEAPSPSPPDPRIPPSGPTNPKRRQAFLTLVRVDDGWRVQVPAPALKNLARQLGVSLVTR